MAHLIYPHGAINPDAVNAEIERLLADLVETYRSQGSALHDAVERASRSDDRIRYEVEYQARVQRRPFVQQAIRWTAAERAEYDRLTVALNSCPVSAPRRYEELAASRSILSDAVERRALEAVESGALVLLAAE